MVYYNLVITYADEPELNTIKVVSETELGQQFPWIIPLMKHEPELFGLRMFQGLCETKIAFAYAE